MGPGVHPFTKPLSGAASDASSLLVNLSLLEQLFGGAISGVTWAPGPVSPGMRTYDVLLYWGSMFLSAVITSPCLQASTLD